jgi:phosphomevalonate kinase
MALPKRQPAYYPEIQKREHDDLPLPETKRVILWGWNSDTSTKIKVAVDSDGNLITDTQLDVDELEELVGKNLVNVFGEASVAGSTESLLISTTVATGKKLRIHGIFGEGGTDGIFRLYIDSVKVWQTRNSWTKRDVYANLEMEGNAGDLIELKVENQKPTINPFSGGFYGYEL